MSAIYDEKDVKGLYGGVKLGAPLSLEESQRLGLPWVDPLQVELERAYEKHVAGNPDQAAARIWTAERVGIPQWIQDRDEMYAKEAETRLALLEKKSPDWTRMVAFSPATSKFLSYDDVMASAYDDVDNLAAMEEESKRAARVKKNLNGLLQRGASGRTAIMRKLKADIKPSDIVLNAGTTDPEKGTGSPLGRDADTFAPGAIRGRDTDTSQSIDINKALGDWFMSTDIGKGYASGKEMSEIGLEAVNLFASESATGSRDEAKWVELEKRRLALDREMPEGWFGEMLFATGKLYGQQASGAVRTSAMAATGAALGALAVGATAPVSLPAIGVIAGMTSLLGWKIGAELGVFAQSGQIEAGHDLIERRMMKDAEGNHLSPMAIGLGSMATGALNGALEVAFWTIPFNPLGKTAAAVKIQQAVIPKVAVRISKLPAFVKMAGMQAKNIIANDFYESGTEVLQDAIPIAIDEFQKAALLDGHDMRSIGDISAQLQDTFRQSMFDFALISAIGPVAAGVRGDYRAEIIRKEMEARQVQYMNSNLDNFAAKIGASKLLQRIPGMSKDFAGELLDGADARTVYVPATSVQQMFQDGLIETEQEDAAAWAEEALGVDPEDFRSSLEGGPDIEIEAIKLFDSVPDKAQDAIRKTMRFSADGMTLGEAEAMSERITKVRQGDLFNVAYELEREMSEAASAHKVFESMRLQMEAQGMDPEIAANTAWAASRMYIPMARMWNEKRTSQDLITPEDVAEMFPISFTQNDDGSMGMYFQALGEKGAGQLDAAETVTMRLDNLTAAKRELAAGKSPLKVKMAYGWEQGVDGKWRMETGEDFELEESAYLQRHANDDLTLKQLIKDPENNELLKAYPQIGDIKIKFVRGLETDGSYSHNENTININDEILPMSMSEEALVNAKKRHPLAVIDTLEIVLVHELQHAVQAIEGFARGGSPDNFRADFYKTQQYKDARAVFNHFSSLRYFPKFFNYLEFKKGRRIISPTGMVIKPEVYKNFIEEKKLKDDFDQYKEEVENRQGEAVQDIETYGEDLFDQLLSDYEDYDKRLIEFEQKYNSDYYTYIFEERRLSRKYAFEKYHSLAGEVEARNVEKRMEMSAAERRAFLLSETEDVSREDQIILDSMLRKAELAEELRGFQARGEVDAGYFDNVIEKAKQIDKKDYGVDVRMNGRDLISDIYDSILMEEIQTEHDLLLSNESKLREYIEGLDDIEELAGDMPVDEWIKTEEARSYVVAPEVSFESRKQSEPNEQRIIDEAWKRMDNAVYEYISDNMKLFEEIAESQGFTVIDENGSKLSKSQYISMTPAHNIDEFGDVIDQDKVYKVRFSDHEDKHGGNDLNLSFETSTVENAIALQKFLKNKTGGQTFLQAAIQKIDSEYLSAVARDDMDTAQRMVDESAERSFANSTVRDDNGKLLLVYHGTEGDFTVFDRAKARANMDIQGNFFSPWKEDAAGYGSNVGKFYLNITNPASGSAGYESLRRFKGQNYAGVKARDYLEQSGYDGVNNENEEYIAFYPDQIKSADPITYDDKGNVIPLSKRFNLNNDDIRYQPHRGSITFPRQAGQPIRISWSKNADASTVIHELAHFYLWQLRQFRNTPSVAIGRYGRRATDDLDLISNWWSDDAGQITDWIQKQAGMSEMVKAGATEDNFINWISSGMERDTEMGKAFDTAAHEYFARGFEAYMREGRAPTAELQSVFRRFKKWLTEIYKSMTELNVELSDDVRAVYDRMLASEEAIEQFKAEMEIEELLRSEEDNIPDDYPFEDEDPFEAAKERLLGILMDEISPENRKKMLARADEIRPRIAAEVSTEKGWTTVNMYEENPDRRISESEILDRYGETVISQLSPAVMDPDGISVEIAAKDMGYGSADELINDLTGKTSLQAEIDARVKAQIEREFASIINDPAKLDAAAEAAWYEGEEHSDDLAADMVVPMSEYAELYGESEQAAAEQESPRERRKVINWIRNHGGILYSSVAQEFGDERARELVRRVGPGLLSKTGFGLDSLAQEMSGNGFMIESDEDLFKILLEGEDARKDPLEEAKEQGRAEVLQEVKTKRALEKMIAVEKKRLEKEIKQKYNKEIKNVKSAAETAAENIVSGFAIEKLRDTAKYIRAEKEARRKADAALRKNDETEFRRWRERELMQHMIVKAMYRSQRQAEGIRSWLERYAKRTNTQTFGMTPNFIEQVDALLTRFDIRKTRSMTAKQRAMVGEAPALDNFIREMDAEGTPILIPDWILSSNETRHYTQLMTWQLKEVKEAIQNIVTVGRQEKQTISLAQNEKLADIADKIYAAAKAFWTDRVTGERIIDPKERKRNIKELAKGYLADLETIEAMCRALDGYKELGPAHRYIFQPIRSAMSKETLELNRVFALAREIRNKAYDGNPMVDNWSVQFDIPVYKRAEVEPGKFKMIPTKEKLTLNREQAICAVLNMGNEGNMARLRDGWGWSQQDMSEILNSLSEQDIRYIEGIWDLVESMWPQVKKVSELMTGRTLEKVQAKLLITKFGTLKGGYYPIVTDLRYSTVAAAQSELETALASATLNYAHSHTKAGHRKARAVDVLGRPPMLSLGVLDNHLANVIHDFSVAPALRDVRKVLKNQLVETTILEVLGEDRKKNINKWLNDVAANTKNNGVSLSKGEVIANRARSGVAMFALGANMGGALMQPLGYFPLAHRIGLVRTARAILNGLMGNTDVYSFVLEKSEFMREQYNGQNVEVRKLRQNWSSQKGGLKWYQDRMLDIYPMLQNLCNVPGWAEAYKMGIEKYEGNEADAIAFADSIIRQTQSASNLADLSTLERSGTFGSLVTMFYSWFRVMYQMQNEAIIKTIHGHGLRGRFGDLASYALYVLIAQGVAESLLRGYGPDDDDDDGEAEKWAKWTAQRLMLAPISTVPIARDIVSVFEVGQYRFTPIEASFKSVSKLLLAAEKAINPPEGKERDLEPLVWSGAEVVGYGTGLPNRAMLRAAKSFWELYNEDEAIPWAYVILGGGFRPKK